MGLHHQQRATAFFCQARGIPYALYAQSFELAPPAGLVLGNLFSGAAAISCRASRSLSTLQGTGVWKAALAAHKNDQTASSVARTQREVDAAGRRPPAFDKPKQAATSQ